MALYRDICEVFMSNVKFVQNQGYLLVLVFSWSQKHIDARQLSTHELLK